MKNKPLPAILALVDQDGTDETKRQANKIQDLLIKRASLLKLAAEKIQKVVMILDEKNYDSCLVYCHDT